MAEFLRQHWAYLIGAVLLHVLFAGIFGLTLISMRPQTPPPTLAIQAVVVDPSVLSRASRQQQRQRERQRERAQQAEREAAAVKQREEQETQARRESEQRAEQERQAEQKRREEEVQRRRAEEQQLRERQEAERKQQIEAERQRAAEAERKRVQEIERKQKEAEARRRAEAEAQRQAASEADLRRQLEEEEGELAAESAGILDAYRAMIEQHIYSYWRKPPSARPGIECIVTINQAPSGSVLSVQIGACNGDSAVRQSIEAAVQRASPLPLAPDPRVFQRTVILQFRPRD